MDRTDAGGHRLGTNRSVSQRGLSEIFRLLHPGPATHISDVLRLPCHAVFWRFSNAISVGISALVSISGSRHGCLPCAGIQETKRGSEPGEALSRAATDGVGGGMRCHHDGAILPECAAALSNLHAYCCALITNLKKFLCLRQRLQYVLAAAHR